jgi:hypothetical protein
MSGDSEVGVAAGMKLRVLPWVLLMILASWAGFWVVHSSWAPENNFELMAVMVFFMGNPIGSFWMVNRVIRFESKKAPYIVLAFVPMSFLWYYVERVRSSPDCVSGQ